MSKNKSQDNGNHQYKDSLNLPTTDFDMRANLPTKEPKFVEFWESINLYAKQRKAFEGKPKFVLHDGPPYANGALHLGHFVNKTLKDIITKSHSQLGFDTPYVPGWDCHGLPIELVVERKYGKVGPNMTAQEFRQKCADYAATQVDLQKAEFQRFGILGDFDHPYLTYDKKIEANTVRALAEIYKNGHMERGSRPVNWCLDCGSSLAEAEVEYADKVSTSIDVKFAVQDVKALSDAIGFAVTEPVSVVIWTTTPWTLPCNEAVSVHPEYDYALVRMNGENIIVAAELVEGLAKRWKTELEVIHTFKGQAIENLALSHCFYEKTVPVILGEHVTLDGGTGCVHTAPSHGDDDYKVGLQYHLPMGNYVLGNGDYASDVPLFAGQNIMNVTDNVLDTLRSHNNLVFATKIEHSYPHCWRHKTPTIYRATAQWFISMDKKDLRQEILTEIDKVKFTPSWGQARLYGMIEGRGDWCISRQRYWGVPIPLFLHKETGELHPQTGELMEQVAAKIEDKGLTGWFEADITEFLNAEDAANYEKNKDILDVWFDSGTTHYTVLRQRPELSYPADLYLEGSDQHRGWFNSSICTSVAMDGIAPYKQLLTHGFTVDAQGRKMSKSLGNGVEPQDVMDKMGADVLRLWVSSTDYRGEIPVSDEILKRTSETYRRIRNTVRFLLANTGEFDYAKDAVPMDELLPLDRWVIDRAHQLQAEIGEHYVEFAFHNVYQKLQSFCSIDLGSFYLDIIKDRQYTCAKDSKARRSCQTALHHVLEALVRWMAPILSFTAEEIWQNMRQKDGSREESIFLAEFYKDLVPLDDAKFDRAFWDMLLNVRSEVSKEIEKYRANGEIGSSLQSNVTIYCTDHMYNQLMQLEDELRFVLLTSYANVKPLSDNTEELPVLTLEDEQFAIEISVNHYKKCVRCWHYREDVGTHADHPELCDRCITNLTEEGENRKYA
ncbi:isoleucine--tRNA ligase [Wohlfahrtiimonas chitiniclastica]|uniref:isoleucine--tRNA ligase n=1 Tax=Wohlfahrtiimonas chitiniclastica TaxID=400946 RepID=UPI0007B4089D|nr:isoleucine--tRNA ligase [Wohlfahrtiimonas chitiniclastica]KZS23741.1 isoleucine--tRNA ligase [Wohlfahrtiimonas chitiniclastica]MBS7814416.1 isoleucine--tRNA ligase [Wohlfahrtiimonas chitiniclastica]MDC7251797.1 isoleucine--tRNA ligase [Wohlfahrtiimonas chitiniclastica]WHR56128.1 isoleucine--tRNA ligase [Wohlfahrtiimonas chitiniclastica]